MNSRRSPARRIALRTGTAAIVLGALLPLAGCLSLSIPDGAEVTPIAPLPSATAPLTPPSTAPESADLPDALDFTDGAELSPADHIEWGDSLMFDDAWVGIAPDDGQGGWTYGTADGACTAQFWQGYISDVPTPVGDDRLGSDAMLAMLLGTDAATVAPIAVDGLFGYLLGGNPGVEHRQVQGQQDGRDWIIAARAFTTAGAGLYVIVDCTGGDVGAVFAEVVEKSPIIVTRL